ncbi:MAG: hypothetical protein SFU56_16680 [Capsulimonadales bacterium]|nr:hypothetical protein [Capsulimonadales bacterium]
MTNYRGRRHVVIFLLLTLLSFASLRNAQAQEPKLTQNSGSELQNAYQDKKPYTLRLLFTDPSGDTVSKSKAIFVDEGPSGNLRIPATNITGDVRTGAVIEWRVNGFEPGSHKGYFEVSRLNDTAPIRYPAEPTEFYSFVVENLTTKWIIFGVGLLIGLTAIPAIVFFLSRSINPRGDSSQAARLGLFFGILAICVLFIGLFLSIYGWLVFAIIVLAFLALPLLFTRRR